MQEHKQDHGSGSGDHAYKEAGLRFLFYHKISRLSDGCIGFGICGLRRE